MEEPQIPANLITVRKGEQLAHILPERYEPDGWKALGYMLPGQKTPMEALAEENAAKERTVALLAKAEADAANAHLHDSEIAPRVQPGDTPDGEQSHADPVDTKGPEDEPLEGDDETEDDTEVD